MLLFVRQVAGVCACLALLCYIKILAFCDWSVGDEPFSGRAVSESARVVAMCPAMFLLSGLCAPFMVSSLWVCTCECLLSMQLVGQRMIIQSAFVRLQFFFL